VSIVVGRVVLPGNGFTAAHGFRVLSLADGPVLRAAVGSVLYLVLIGWFSLGVATAVRDSAMAIGLVLGVLYLAPIVAAVVGDPRWHRRLEQYAPMQAGLSVQTTVNVAAQPIAPWAGLGVLAAWALGALLVGGLVLRVRDA
jgi:ABC-2 type transport system permease protein